MKSIYKICSATALLTSLFGYGNVSAQADQPQHWLEEIPGILRDIEYNNTQLEARRKLLDVQGLELRMENNLEDPEVEFIHQWGRPSAAGPASELTITQTFDFPTVYARRAKLAEMRAQAYGYQYEAYRQEILFEAQALCIRILSLREKGDFLREAMNDAGKIADLMAVRVDAGDANALEHNKAQFEYISAANAYKLNEIELVDVETRLTILNGGEPVTVHGNSLNGVVILPTYNDMATIYDNMSPDILMTKSLYDAAQQDVLVSRSKTLPKLAVGYKRDTGPGEKLNGVVAGITIPLFSNRNNVKRAKAEAAYARTEQSRARSDIQSTLIGLYARAELLQTSSEQYGRILDYSDSVGLLRRALDEGHISVIDYYSQLQPIYESSMTMIEVMEEYHLICAMINSVFL